MKHIYLLLVLSLLSCTGNNSLKKDLELLHSKPIELPINSKMTFLGKDTLIEDYFDSKYKMIIYIDAISCSSCELNKLYLWENLIKWTNDNGDNVKYYFIFNPPKNENIRLSLRNSLLGYPMLLDNNGEFEQLNPHLPKNRSLHTFLIDDNNNVILVGNPIHNQKIENIFKEKIKK